MKIIYYFCIDDECYDMLGVLKEIEKNYKEIDLECVPLTGEEICEDCRCKKFLSTLTDLDCKQLGCVKYMRNYLQPYLCSNNLTQKKLPYFSINGEEIDGAITIDYLHFLINCFDCECYDSSFFENEEVICVDGHCYNK